jgi:hypothetical protein
MLMVLAHKQGVRLGPHETIRFHFSVPRSIAAVETAE